MRISTHMKHKTQRDTITRPCLNINISLNKLVEISARINNYTPFEAAVHINM